MTIVTTPLIVETAALETVTVDMYRDIHKGIRAGLFAVTQSAGQVDPHDQDAVRAVGAALDRHGADARGARRARGRLRAAGHRAPNPEYAEEIAVAHPRLEAQMAALEVLADRAADACPSRPASSPTACTWASPSFTSEYLQHQEFEEFEVMAGSRSTSRPRTCGRSTTRSSPASPPSELAASASSCSRR